MKIKPIHRRTVLRGLGTAICLPFLEAMTANAMATAGEAPLRVAFLFVPNGMHMPDWTPTKVGANFDIPKTLEPVGHLKDQWTS